MIAARPFVENPFDLLSFSVISSWATGFGIGIWLDSDNAIIALSLDSFGLWDVPIENLLKLRAVDIATGDDANNSAWTSLPGHRSGPLITPHHSSLSVNNADGLPVETARREFIQQELGKNPSAGRT